MKENLKKLVDVKSIVTLTLVITMVIAILGKFEIETNMFQLFSSAIMLVLGFFFGKKDSETK